MKRKTNRRASRPVAETLLWLAIVCLPLQQALTLSVGFPLKLTEVFAIAGLVAAVVQQRRGYFVLPSTWMIAGIAAVTLLSTVWTALAPDPANPPPRAYPRGLMLDLFLYTGYAALAMAFCIAVAVLVPATRLVSAVKIAVRLAAAYTALQLVLWVFSSNFLTHLNGNLQLGALYGIQLPRNGPFLEGNYLGFFAAAAIFVVVRGKDWWGLGLALALFFYSQSTGAFVAIAVALVAVVLLRPRLRTILFACAVGVIGIVIALVVPPANRFVVAQLTKLGLIENNIGVAFGWSLRGRTANAETAFSMAADNPFFGVGQGRYAAHYWQYLDLSGLPSNFASWVVRPIANNVYAQIAAETGLVALALFIALLGYLMFRARAESGTALGFIVAVAVCIIAFPTWTGLPLWTMLAIAIAFVDRPPRKLIANLTGDYGRQTSTPS